MIQTTPSVLNKMFFFKNWTYALELPLKRISGVHFEKRAGISTLVVHKKTRAGGEKQIPVSLQKARQNQIEFIKESLPWIVDRKPTYPEIKKTLSFYQLA